MKKLIVLLGLFLLLINCVFASTSLVSTSSSTSFKIEVLRYEPAPAEPGKFMDLWVKASTQGDTSQKELEDVKLEFVDEFPFSAVSEEEKVKDFGTMSSSESRVVKYRIKVDGNANPGTHEIRFKYYSNLKKGGEISAPLEIEIQSVSATIAVTEVKSEPEKIMPGSKAKLTLTLRNDALVRLRDIKTQLDLASDDMPFAPLNSTSEKKIQSINPGESFEIVYDIIVLASADSEVYKIPLTLNYFDNAGNEYTIEDIIGLVVEAEPSLSINLESFDIFKKGETGNVVVSISNVGPSDIKYAVLEILDSEEYIVLEKRKEYLGNMESDDFETAEFKLNIQDVENDAEIKLLLKYKDAYNRDREDYFSLNLPIYSLRELRKYGIDGDISYIFMPFVYLLMILFIFYTIKDWKKNKALDLALKKGLEDTFILIFKFIFWFRWRNLKRLPIKIKIFFRKL